MVELPYPASDGDPRVRVAAVEALLAAGFESWRDKILGRYFPLDAAMSSHDVQGRVLDFAAESFRLIARSRVFGIPSGAFEPKTPQKPETRAAATARAFRGVTAS